jgi:predicted dehydrogenase
MNKIRFGIIGCGDVTEKKSGPAFKKIEGSDLTMVMRRDEEKLIDYAKRHKIDAYTTDYKTLLDSQLVDAIYIATPPKWHHFYVLEAAKYKKPIYVEKPMALSVAECEEMVNVCREYNVPLFVAYYRRGQEKFKHVKSLIEEKAIGEIRSFHYVYTSKLPELNPDRNWMFNKEESGGGLLYDMGSHMIDILLFFFGEVKSVYGHSDNQSNKFRVHDVTTGMIVFESGVGGSVQMTFNGNMEEDELVIVGSTGSIRLSVMSNDPVSVIRDNIRKDTSFDDLEHVAQPFIQEVVDCLHGTNNMDSTGISGLKTQKIIEALDMEV